MLGLRSTWRPDLKASPADLVVGEPLRLPGDLVSPSPSPLQTTSDFVDDLRSRMASLRPTQTSHHRSRLNEPSDDPLRRFRGVNFTYVRIDASKPPLVRPYSGPFEIVEKHEKYFVISRKGRHEKISVDRLKPAFGDFATQNPAEPSTLSDRLFKLAEYSRPNEFPTPPAETATKSVSRPSYRDALVAPPTAAHPVVTRSGRVSVPVSRFSP